ncbi:MAG: mechanosensitive ion channel [Nanoarchaeota archaeon]|nr:mechanosensitive ion channel [Nanoarchaeota archaeon]
MPEINFFIEKNYIDFLQSGLVYEVLVALFIFLLGFIAAKFIGRLVSTLLKEIEVNRMIKGSTGIRINFANMITGLVTYSIYLASILMALSRLNILGIALKILGVIVLILVVFTLLLLLIDFVPNFIMGIFMRRNKKIALDSEIRINEIQGKVIGINRMNIVVENSDNDVHVIPNIFLASKLTKVHSVK